MQLILYYLHFKTETLAIFLYRITAATIEVLANALFELYDVRKDIKVIGIRHGEKIYETLSTGKKWQKLRFEKLLQIPADTRILIIINFLPKENPKY